MKCKKIQLLLSAYLDQELDAQTRAMVEEHLDSCTGCHQVLGELKHYLSLAGSVDKVEAPSWLETKIWQEIEEPETTRVIRRSTPGKVIVLRTVSVAAAIFIIAFLIVPPRFYTPQELETSFSFRIVKKGKGLGGTRARKDVSDPRMVLFREMMDSLGGEVLEDGYNEETGQAGYILLKVPKERYKEFREEVIDMKVDENLPETLSWSLFPYTKVQIWFPGRKFVAGDFNGDGFDDMACYFYKGKHAGSWFIAYNDRQQNFNEPVQIGFIDILQLTPDQAIFLSGDMNGDRFDDLVVFIRRNPPTGRWIVYLNDGNGSFIKGKILDVGSDSLTYKTFCTPYMGDFNGDGPDDIGAHFHLGELTGKWILQLNRGDNRFGPVERLPIELEGQGSQVRNFPLVIDYNGDGWDDALLYWQGGPRAASWDVAINLKNGEFAPGYRVWYAFQGSYLPFPGDYNGDGFTDLLVKTGSMDELGEWYMMFNNGGHGFETTRKAIFGSGSNFEVD